MNDKRDNGFRQYIKDWRLAAVSLILGFLMGLMILLGIRYSRNELIYRTLGDFFKQLTGWTVCMTLIVWVLCVGLDSLARYWFSSKKIHLMGQAQAQTNCECQKNTDNCRFRWLLRWLKWMFFSWCIYLPVFLAVYPGIYSYDASTQILQFYGELPLTTHHPLIHTLYLGICMKFAGRVFHTYQAGMAIYSLSQSLFMSAVFSFCLCRMRSRKSPVWLLVLSWMFWILNPYLTVFSFVTTKDVLFGAFFLLAFDGACNLAENPISFWQGEWIFFFINILFMCLFRNQGIYVFLFFLLSVCVLLRKKIYSRKKFIGGSLLVIGIWYLLSGPIPTAFGVGKGDAREMLCVPMQQLARVYHEIPEKLTQEEKEYIELLIDPQALNDYVRVNADPVKSGFRTDVMQADPGKFLKIWSEIGERCPDVYLDSFLMGNWGYWYPGDSQYWIAYILYDGAYLEDDLNILHITRNSHFQALADWLRETTLTPVFQSVPVLSVIFNQAFPFWLMLFVAGFAVWRRRAYEVVPMMILLGYWGTLLLGPVTALRYALPLIYCVPRLAEMIVKLAAGKIDRKRCTYQDS